jgi:hypothetical protein
VGVQLQPVTAGQVLGWEHVVVIVLLPLACFVIGFLVSRWWTVLLAAPPLVLGYIDVWLLAGLLALGVASAKLRRKRLGSRSAERAGELGEDGQISVQPNPIQPPDVQR